MIFAPSSSRLLPVGLLLYQAGCAYPGTKSGTDPTHEMRNAVEGAGWETRGEARRGEDAGVREEAKFFSPRRHGGGGGGRSVRGTRTEVSRRPASP